MLSSLSLQADFLMESACYRTSNTALPDGGGANSKGKIWLVMSTPNPALYFTFRRLGVSAEKVKRKGVPHACGGDPRPTCSMA